MRGYRNEPVEVLAKQLTAGLLRLRKGYVDAAEALLHLIQPDLEYPVDFVVFRLTGYRPLHQPDAPPLPGRTLRLDLQRLVLDLCDSFDLAAAAYGETAYDIDRLAEKFRVADKTIQRWRRRGLVTRRLVFPDGRKRLAVLESSLRAFATRRRRQILRSVRFSHMTGAERQEIFRRARRLASRTGTTLYDISKRLAARTGRAVETIRYTIRKHDREQPAEAIFPGHDGPIDDAAREVMYRCFLHGVPVESLARTYRRTRGSVYRIVNEMRARQLLARKLEFIYCREFDVPGVEAAILAEPPPEEPVAAGRRPRVRAPEDLPPYLRSLYELPLLSPARERHLFRQYNYLKYRADQLRKALEADAARSGQLRAIERMLAQAEGVKGQIVRANLRLVVSIAKKHLRGPQTLFELVSDGNLTLLHAVEKFDYARGFKFSTYASWAIIKNFARSVPKERYLLDRFVTGSEVLELADAMSHYDPRATSISELRESLEAVLAQLAPRERAIIVRHFGLDKADPPQTLEQLSHNLGLSKERVRQIEQRAMHKLRGMLQPQVGPPLV